MPVQFLEEHLTILIGLEDAPSTISDWESSVSHD